MHKLILITFVTCVWSTTTWAQPFTLNDVSVLFPLPKLEQTNELPGVETEAAHGKFIPKKLIIDFPTLAFVGNVKLIESIRAVGVRIDPCFTEVPAPNTCQRQIRIVWQPLEIRQNVISTIDAALHSFYLLTDAEFSQLLKDLQALNKNYPERKKQTYLYVHPVMAVQGLEGDYYQKFIAIIKKYTGERKLIRVTFMQLLGGENIWSFGGVDIKAGEITHMNIPRVDDTIQSFVNTASAQPFWFQGGLSPAPQDVDNLNVLIKDSRKLGPANEMEIIAAAKAAFKFENPKTFHTGNLDCASCHVAQPAKSWALKQYPWLNLGSIHDQEIYKSAEFDLRNPSPMQPHTNVVRAFGYFLNRGIVAQRTINESSEVVKLVNQYLQTP